MGHVVGRFLRTLVHDIESGLGPLWISILTASSCKESLGLGPYLSHFVKDTFQFKYMEYSNKTVSWPTVFVRI